MATFFNSAVGAIVGAVGVFAASQPSGTFDADSMLASYQQMTAYVRTIDTHQLGRELADMQPALTAEAAVVPQKAKDFGIGFAEGMVARDPDPVLARWLSILRGDGEVRAPGGLKPFWQN